ncbi:MAG: FAD-dependent monooxygenase [Clostridia bacterium]|nr:FAD-dependent monooxygenase [Clostridia bacterium]
MTYLVNDIVLPLDFVEGEAFSKASARLVSAGIVPPRDVRYSLFRRSVDARRRDDVRFTVSVLCEGDLPVRPDDVLKRNRISVKREEVLSPSAPDRKLSERPVVVGSGPAGLFAALLLSENGYRPIVLEKGGSLSERIAAVETFRKRRVLDPTTNIQFGAGGAGTFSDGKLVTRINDPAVSLVMRRFVSFGAPPEILTQARPHVGTDLLRDVLSRMISYLEEKGTEFLYHTEVKAVKTDGRSAVSVITDAGEIPCGALVIAVGNSASELFLRLLSDGFPVEPKPFSVGMRIEHPQEMIDRALYGKFAGHPALGHAEYNLSCDTDSRGVYTFCMCPGGEVVPGASEEGTVVVNGMSYHARSGRNANSAVCVSVFTDDYGNTPRGAIEFRQKIERAAFWAGGGRYAAPAVTASDLLAGRAVRPVGSVLPTYLDGDVRIADPAEYLPAFITEGLRRGVFAFDRRIPGFASGDAILTGPETRTSSPVRIRRDENAVLLGFDNIYPCGEGAGYAGGITSSASDGCRVAVSLMSRYAAI